MSKLVKALSLAGLLMLPVAAHAGDLNIGREALPQEIAAWNIDVRPDGLGLPPGKGSVAEGSKIFEEKCAMCHGDFGEGVGRFPVLAGGKGTLKAEHPIKTIGSYWPFASTIYDYIHRAMPFGAGQSLKPDEVYALTAYLLNLNDIVKSDFVLSDKNFTTIKMPNEHNFIMDDREKAEKIFWSHKPCMKDCSGPVKVVSRARALDLTPEKAKAKTKAD